MYGVHGTMPTGVTRVGQGLVSPVSPCDGSPNNTLVCSALLSWCTPVLHTHFDVCTLQIGVSMKELQFSAPDKDVGLVRLPVVW